MRPYLYNPSTQATASGRVVNCPSKYMETPSPPKNKGKGKGPSTAIDNDLSDLQSESAGETVEVTDTFSKENYQDVLDDEQYPGDDASPVHKVPMSTQEQLLMEFDQRRTAVHQSTPLRRITTTQGHDQRKNAIVHPNAIDLDNIDESSGSENTTQPPLVPSTKSGSTSTSSENSSQQLTSKTGNNQSDMSFFATMMRSFKEEMKSEISEMVKNTIATTASTSSNANTLQKGKEPLTRARTPEEKFREAYKLPIELASFEKEKDAKLKEVMIEGFNGISRLLSNSFPGDLETQEELFKNIGIMFNMDEKWLEQKWRAKVKNQKRYTKDTAPRGSLKSKVDRDERISRDREEQYSQNHSDLDSDDSRDTRRKRQRDYEDEGDEYESRSRKHPRR